MKISAMTLNGMREGLDPERIDPPIRQEGIAQTQASQFETGQGNTTQPQFVMGNLANLIEEAKRRAEKKKNQSNKVKLNRAIENYNKVNNFNEIMDEKGSNLDRSS